MKKDFLVLLLTILAITRSFGQSPLADFGDAPKVKWKFKTARPILASPVIDENRVYFGGLDSTLYALDLETGKEIWSFRTKGAIRSVVVLDGEKMYLNGGDGKLYCLNKMTARVIWSFSTGGEKKYDFADYHHSTPLLLDNVLYFGSGDGAFYAVSSRDGKSLWKYQTGDVIHTTPAIENGRVFFGSFDGYVYALNISTGALAWKFKTVGQMYFPKGEVQGSPALYKGAVIIGARDFNVYAISQSKGVGLWNRYLPKGWGLVNTIADSVLYVGTGDERKLLALDPRNGREYWSKEMEFLVFGSNAYSQNMLYLGTTIGKMHGIYLSTGDTKWTLATDGYNKNRYRYFKEDDSYRDDIYSIIKSNEQFLEVEFELGGIFSTPAISKDVLVFTSSEGRVYCLKR